MNNIPNKLSAILFLAIGLFNECSVAADNQQNAQQQIEASDSTSKDTIRNKVTRKFTVNPDGDDIRTRFVNEDTNYVRPYNTDYAQWLLNRKLFPFDHKVRYYNGEEKQNSNGRNNIISVGVLKYDLVGTFSKNKERPADLQQCADACIRLWAEYLWEHKMYDKIHFKNAPGFVFSYKKWAEGYRVHFDKNWKASWSKDAGVDYSYATFRKYLSLVFTYCGTATLAKEMMPVKSTDIQPGDILIWGGSPGHAVTVMDVLRNKQTGKLKVMFSQSYMP
ncbi:MAG: hypothetical protein J5614_10550, partial [Paludibacteraceae bacterium]|nr:hypothetical protein [Paludibacteraceae bacterium]